MATWPAPDAARELHRRLSPADPNASSHFACALVDPLLVDLRATHPWADEHLLLQAAEDAVLSVIRHPDRYDPGRSELRTFLRMAAGGDLRNALARERRHHQNRDNSVELPDVAGNEPVDADDLPSLDGPALAPVVAGFTAAERAALDLMRAGERRTEAFAAALRLADRPADEQRREVKRVKDRILQRLRRAGGYA